MRAWEERWWELAGELGGRVEAIIGAPAGSVSMHENVTTAEAVALSCIKPDGPRRKIVCTAMDFPSAVYLYKGQRDLGFDLDIVPALDDLSVPADRIAAAIDERTAVVCLSHVLFRSSYIVDPTPGRREGARRWAPWSSSTATSRRGSSPSTSRRSAWTSSSAAA